MGRSASTDPLEKFRFLVDFAIPGAALPVRTGFHDIQMPKRSTNKIAYREGQNVDISTQSAGLSTFEDIVMSNGVLPAVASAAGDELYQWMSVVHKPGTGINGYTTAGDQASAPAAARGKNDYRTEVTIKMLDRSGVVVRAWRLYQAWPMNFVPGSDLNAGEDGDKSLQSLTLCYEDFQEMVVADGAVTAAAY